MAQKRMIDKKISVSEQVANLSLLARLIFTWAIPHSDDLGMLPFALRTLKATVMPMADDVSQQQFNEAVEEIVQAGLWEVFTFGEESLYRMVGFADHQTLKKDREPQTILKSISSWVEAESLGLVNTSSQKERERLEYHFEEFLSENIEKIEPGLKLIKRQYQIKKGARQFIRVDILAEDKNKLPVLIELKIAEVKDFTVVWQGREYRDLYHQQEGVVPRVIIIAPSFTQKAEELAVKESVELFRMEVPNFQMEDISFPNGREEKRREVKRREEKPHAHLSWLNAIPETDLKELCEKYEASITQIKRKGEELANYCQAKGKVYKNYRAFIENALQKDFGRRKKIEPVKREVIAPLTPEAMKIMDSIRGMGASKRVGA